MIYLTLWKHGFLQNWSPWLTEIIKKCFKSDSRSVALKNNTWGIPRNIPLGTQNLYLIELNCQYSRRLTLWTRRAGLAAYANRGPETRLAGFSGICYGVSKTRWAFKPGHVRLIIKWFVYTGRYQATLRSQVESSSLFSFLTICNLLTGFCTPYTNLRRKYIGDTQCMWRYRYSLHVMDNVEELYNQKIGFWDRNGGIHGTC